VNRRRTLLAAVAASIVTRPLAAQSARAKTLPRIGILTLRARAGPMNEPLMDGLRQNGYVEGSTCVIDYPDAQGREDRLAELAGDLVKRKADVILVIGPAPLAAARAATTAIPLVMVASSADPVAEGIATSIARPGGNVTGLTYAEPDRFKKQLEFLKSVAPRIGRVVALWDFDVDIYRRDWQAPLTDAGRVLGIAIADPVRVRIADDLPAAFATIKARADAFIVAAAGANFAAREQIANLALEHRLPGIAAFEEFPERGLLMSYGPDLPDINRRAAAYVDRILKGAKPGDLPIQFPHRFNLVINSRTADSLGLKIPADVRARADRWI
jgi:ABC-type uncharacterized transport system substrate-binding protein